MLTVTVLTHRNINNMPIKNDALKVNKECVCCHNTFKDYASKSTKVCPECLKKEHFFTCKHCGKVVKYESGSLINFFRRNFCSVSCMNNHHYKRGDILSSIYNNLISPHNFNDFQRPKIKMSDHDIDEIVAENCALLVLFQLYSELEPYYDECVTGMKLEKYLPSTQQYLLDVLHYIKVINKILRIEPKEVLLGQYADGRRTRYQDQGNWETGPTDEDIKHVEE